MSNPQGSRFLTLVQREFREYRNSLFWTPVVTALVLGVLMLGSVVLVNRIAVIGDTVLEALMREDSGGLSVSISVSEGDGGDQGGTVVEVGDVESEVDLPDDIEVAVRSDGETQGARIEFDTSADSVTPPSVPVAPGAPDVLDYEVISSEDGDEEQWNFSREWTFDPEPANGGDAEEWDEMSGRELNVMLGMLHGILIVILLITTVNYLLSTLYDDRKDRSILFYRSMPVNEWEVVLSKFVVALILAPVIYIAVSLLLQLAYVLMMMLLVWRMEQDPYAVVVDNIDFAALMLDPLSGWVLTALLIAPTYAWFLCASAVARRSPFLMAVTPIIALFIAEAIFLGSEHVADAVQNHVPHLTDESAVGFYLFGPDWTALNLGSLAGGLVFAALMLAAAVWFRQYRWELN